MGLRRLTTAIPRTVTTLPVIVALSCAPPPEPPEFSEVETVIATEGSASLPRHALEPSTTLGETAPTMPHVREDPRLEERQSEARNGGNHAAPKDRPAVSVLDGLVFDVGPAGENVAGDAMTTEDVVAEESAPALRSEATELATLLASVTPPNFTTASFVVADGASKLRDRATALDGMTQHRRSATTRRSGQGERGLPLPAVSDSQGSFGTPQDSTHRAAETGVEPAEPTSLESRPDRTPRPRVASTAGAFINGAGVQSAVAGGAFSVRTWAGRLGLSAEGRRSQLSQRATLRQMTELVVQTDSFVVGATGKLFGGVNVAFEDAGPTIPGGFVAIALDFENRSTWSARAGLDPVWRPGWGLDPLGPMRLRDLAQVDSDLTVAHVKVSGVTRWGPRGRMRVEVGGTRLSDGNRRLFGGGGIRLPIVDRSVRIALEPNGYGEVSRLQTPGLLTPAGYAEFGTAALVDVQLRGLEVSLTTNPHVFFYPDLIGFGVSGRLSSTIDLGAVSLELSGSLVEQAVDSFIQGSAGLGLPIG